MRVWLVGVVFVALACTGGSPAPSPSPAPSVSEPAAPAKAGKKRGKEAGGAPLGEGAAPAAPDPLAGLSTAQLCADDALLLLKYPFDDLREGKCHDVCCAAVPGHSCCDLDWPFSDVPSCSEYARMRNGIFARYGYPFTEKKWQDTFGHEPYYERREDYTDSWLGPVARDNVALLKRKEDKKEGCAD